MIRTVTPVRAVTWNKDGSTFAYAEETKIILRDSSGYKLIQTINTANGLIDFLQFPQSTAGFGDQLVSLSEDNVLEFRILPQTDPIHITKTEDGQTSTALAYNYNGNYIATGSNNGTLNVLLQNYLTNVFISRTFSQLEVPIYSVYFSRDNKFLVSGSADDSACVWDVASGKLLNAFPYYSETKVPVLMTHDNRNIIMTTEKNKIGIFDLNFKQLREIETEVDVQSMTLTADGNRLIILTTDNFFYFYDLISTKIVNYIPPYNSSRIVSYAFNNTTTRAVVCHEDGCLYVLDIKKVLLDPSMPAPRFDAQVADETSDFEITQYKPQEENIPENRSLQIKRPEYEDDGKRSSSDAAASRSAGGEPGYGTKSEGEGQVGRLEEVHPDEESNEAEEDDKNSKKDREKKKEDEVNLLSEFLFQNNERANTIEIGVLGSLYPSPYLFAAGIDACWRNSIWTAPFYFGAGLKGTVGFPTSDFPYSYYDSSGESISSPCFIDAKIYIPGGLQIILPGNVLRISTELFISGGISMLWSFGYASSSPFFSFGGGMRVIFGVKYVGVSLGVQYDSILGFVPEIMVSGRIPFHKKN